jgi:hypothetical protein
MDFARPVFVVVDKDKPMGFFARLRRALGGDAAVDKRLADAWNLNDTDEQSRPLAEPETFHGSEYDLKNWRKKLKRILDELPESQGDWTDHLADAHALGIRTDQLATWGRDEFALLVRKVVADRVVTEDEHRKLDLAREILEIPDPEAEQILHEVVAEAEAFFGGKVEGA